MATDFEEALSEITGGAAGGSPELQPEQTQAAPAESNPFDQALAEKIQESESPAQSPDRDISELGGGRER